MPSLRIRSLTHLVALVVTVCGCALMGNSQARADQPIHFVGHGHQSGHGHHGDHHGGRSFIGISPGGISYGYYGKNFGISMGPAYVPYRAPYYGPQRYYAPSPVYGQENYVQSAPSSAPVRTVQAPTRVIRTNDAAAEYQLRAEDAFARHDYEEAVRQSRHAVLEDPRNGKLHLFASQALFAVGNYHAAAAAIHAGAALLNENDWGFVVEDYQEFYTNDDYVAQMNRLIDFIKQNPDIASAHFVRGYHYAYLGHDVAARKELTRVLHLEPGDGLAEQLLVKAGGAPPEQITAEPLPIPETAVAPKPADIEEDHSDAAAGGGELK